MPNLIIDRIEDAIAVCEYGEGETLCIPRTLLPEQASEGDALRIVLDESETKQRKAYADALLKQMFKQ